MNSKQHAVLWLGVLLIIVRLFATTQWSTLWKTLSLSTGSTGGAAIGSAGPIGPIINCSTLGVGSPSYFACIAANSAKGLLADGTPKPTPVAGKGTPV